MEITLILSVLSVGLFLWEFIAKKKNSNFKPSTGISRAASQLISIFRWIGEKIAIISSFYTYINIKEIKNTWIALEIAYTQLFISPKFSVLGYIKKMNTFQGKQTRVVLGTLTLLLAPSKYIFALFNLIKEYVLDAINDIDDKYAFAIYYALLFLKIYFSIFIVLFIFEYIGRWRQSNIKPTTLINYLTKLSENVFERVGAFVALISSFYTYINFEWLREILKDLGDTFVDLVEPAINVVLSPLWVFIGYVKTMNIYKKKYLIIFGSITLGLLLTVGPYWLLSHLEWIPVEYSFWTMVEFLTTKWISFYNTISLDLKKSAEKWVEDQHKAHIQLVRS